MMMMMSGKLLSEILCTNVLLIIICILLSILSCQNIHYKHKECTIMEKPDFLNNNGVSDMGLHPMQSLETEALYMSGMSRERAFAIDTMNIGSALPDFAYNRLIDALFIRISNDKDEVFRNMFTRNKELHMVNLADYLLMRTGGPPVYAVKVGIPDLGRSHVHLNINQQHVEKFLDHMEEALHDCRFDFKDEYVGPLMDFFRYQATLIILYKRKHEEIIGRSSLF